MSKEIPTERGAESGSVDERLAEGLKRQRTVRRVD
jgi:hypothetical protein